MTRETVVVGVNGSVGVGKSWFIQGVRSLFKAHSTYAVAIKCPRDFIWEEFREHIGYHDSYEQFKKERGEAGRQELIQFAENKRQEDTHYWARAFCEWVVESNFDIVLNDSVAFPVEHDFLLRTTPFFITIVIAPPRFSIGSFYEDDYRTCVAPVNGFRAYDSNEALTQFKKKISNARRSDEAWNRIKLGGVLGESDSP